MSQLDVLTAAELRVLGLMAEAETNLEIALRLGVSPRTVESQVQSILRKLDLRADCGVDRRVVAVLIYLRSGGHSTEAGPVGVPTRV